MTEPAFRPVADCAVLVELGAQVSDAVSARVIALDRAIAQAEITGLQEVIPALVNLSVVFDPLVTGHTEIEQAIRGLLPLRDCAPRDIREHIVPVCYDAELTPDLDAVAATHGISTEAVITAHLSQSYRVGMYGFAPGYAYLSGVAPEIQVPRKTQATRDIPAGSVMIAGPLCIVTTLVMPTGWTIIGRSGVAIMTGDPDRPFLFDVGDTVRFERISRAELPAQMQTP